MSRTDPNSVTLPRKSSAGFPLAALALLITAFACLFASIDLKRWNEQYQALSANDSWLFVILVAVAGTIGGIIGLLGLFASRSTWRVRLLAPLAGILAGETALFLLMAPGPVWRTIFATAILLVTAIIFRLDSD